MLAFYALTMSGWLICGSYSSLPLSCFGLCVLESRIFTYAMLCNPFLG